MPLVRFDAFRLWCRQPCDTAEDLYSVHFVDTMTGWPVGGCGTIVKTIEGGASAGHPSTIPSVIRPPSRRR